MKLRTIKNTKGLFALLDFSRIAMQFQSQSLDFTNPQQKKAWEEMVSALLGYLSAEVSGVALDPDATLPSIAKKANGAGLLLALEKKAESVDPFSLPTLVQNWGVEHIRNNYGVAKLELYYHPQEPEAMRKKQFVAEIYDYCKYEGIDLLLELLVYHPISEQATIETLFEAQLQSAQELSASCDMFALEYLGNALSAVTLTAELDTPWLYNAREVLYDEFKQSLRVCLDSGAQGFLAGDPFFSTSETLQALQQSESLEAKEEYIKTHIRDMIIESVRILNEAVIVE